MNAAPVSCLQRYFTARHLPLVLRFSLPTYVSLWTLKRVRQTHCLGLSTQTSLFLKALTRCASLRSLTVMHCQQMLFWPRLRASLIYEYEHKCLTTWFLQQNISSRSLNRVRVPCMNPWSWPPIPKDSNMLSAEQMRHCCSQCLDRLG